MFSKLRPFIFKLDPELAHTLAIKALKFNFKSIKNIKKNSSIENTLLGKKFFNPIGIAAGFDKDAEVYNSLFKLGFGFVEVGTITPLKQYGNPKPRIMRLSSEKALVNSLGFPGKGLDSAIHHLRDLEPPRNDSKRVISISGTEINDIRDCHIALEPFVSAVEINISSPNTSGLKIFQEPQNLGNLLETINESRNKPLFVKLPPFDAINQEESQERIFELADKCANFGVSSVTVSNTLPVKNSGLAIGQGGLSGAPLFENTIAMVKAVSKQFGSKLKINACGGISNGKQVYQALASGASSIQLYTSLVYEGPSLIQRMKKELATEILNMKSAD